MIVSPTLATIAGHGHTPLIPTIGREKPSGDALTQPILQFINRVIGLALVAVPLTIEEVFVADEARVDEDFWELVATREVTEVESVKGELELIEMLEPLELTEMLDALELTEVLEALEVTRVDDWLAPTAVEVVAVLDDALDVGMTPIWYMSSLQMSDTF